MNRRTLFYGAFVLAIAAFLGGTYWFAQGGKRGGGSIALAPNEALLVRDHSPSFGALDAPVTVVEFFDPACETCRAFHPVVKEILDDFKGQVRVVLRYAAFHQGSDEVVRMLETARSQGVFEPVLEAVLAAQPQWASHGAPNLPLAWAAAERAGLDVERARQNLNAPAILDIARQDADDIAALGVRKTPTFFVNGKPLPSFGMQQLYDLVHQEVRAASK